MGPYRIASFAIFEGNQAVTGGSPGRIAIADDDWLIGDSLAALIETYGFDVRTFGSAAELLRGHAAEPADCLIVDHRMPDVTGLETLQMLRQQGDNTPAILITGMPEHLVQANARSLGATAVLYKPVSHAELMVAIHKAISSTRSKRKARDS